MNIKHYLFACLSLLALTACSEADDTVEEFADWQNKNEAYFQNAYQQARLSNWSNAVIPSYAKGDGSTTVASTDCILVEPMTSDIASLVEGSVTNSPYFTDSVSVHYRGYLIPSTTYKSGYQFDSSYSGTFDPDVAQPSTFSVSGVVEGFSTALQHMHRGDCWRVTMPYQLGYGDTDYNGIPGYSTLIFEIRLIDFWSAKKGDRN